MPLSPITMAFTRPGETPALAQERAISWSRPSNRNAARGRPITNSGRQGSFKFIGAHEADGAVPPGLTVHWLRHTIGKKLAEAGWDMRTIAAMLGHQTEDVRGITRKKRKKRRARKPPQSIKNWNERRTKMSNRGAKVVKLFQWG